MKMNPSGRVFLIVALTFVMLLLCYYLPTITIGDTTLRKVDMFSDINPAAPDTLQKIPVPQVAKKSAEPWQEVWADGVEPIVDYGDTISGGNGMDHFYSAVLNAKNMDRPVRIAYFGDSFIEADIMVGELRRLLQEKFGGSGVGWADFVAGYNAYRVTLQQSATGLESHVVTRRQNFDVSKEGISQSYYIPQNGATADMHRGDNSRYFHTFNKVYAYARTASPLTIATNAGSVTLQPSSHVQVAKFSGHNLTNINFTFNGTCSGTYLYGAALESDKGIILDNLGIRGTPGISLSAMPANMLADFARIRPYDLIIIHFGLNVVANCKSDAYCQHYMAQMKAAINRLREAYPKASILFVSASDMEKCRIGSGQPETMPEVERLIAYQQNLAAECGVGFYSMFNAMGGKGSIGRMVTQGMAEHDYTHINHKGGMEVAGQFSRSICGGIENYQRKKAAGY